MDILFRDRCPYMLATAEHLRCTDKMPGTPITQCQFACVFRCIVGPYQAGLDQNQTVVGLALLEQNVARMAGAGSSQREDVCANADRQACQQVRYLAIEGTVGQKQRARGQGRSAPGATGRFIQFACRQACAGMQDWGMFALR